MASTADFSKTQRRFYAHSTQNMDRHDWQFLDEHLTSVAKLAAEFAEIFNAAGLAHLAGLLHDLGKYTQEVQRRISGEGIRAEHAVQGARQAIECYGPLLGTLLAYVISAHRSDRWRKNTGFTGVYVGACVVS